MFQETSTELIFRMVTQCFKRHQLHIFLEWLQEDNTSRVLSDEDPLSLKDGIWKRINTLEYYGVHDGAKMHLVHSGKEQIAILGMYLTLSHIQQNIL